METFALGFVAGLLLWNLWFRAIPELTRMKKRTEEMRRENDALRAALLKK